MGKDVAIAKALTAWAHEKYGSASHIDKLQRLSGGASQETWSFDVQTNGAVAEHILRRSGMANDTDSSASAIGLEAETRILKALEGRDIPVPQVFHFFSSDHEIGPAYIMDRIGGETVGRRILRDEAFSQARTKLTTQCGEALARLHLTNTNPFEGLPQAGAEEQLTLYEDHFRGYGHERPVFELALQYLWKTKPKTDETVLVHGDFRLGNLMVSENGLASILDWELSHLGDPREDIAWICVNSWRFGHSENRVGGFGDLETLLDAYADAGGRRFSPSDIDWWELLGSFKWGIMCMTMYEAYRTRSDPSVERAAIGRRVSETEIDMLNLIERMSGHA